MAEILRTSVPVEYVRDETEPPEIVLREDDVQAEYGYTNVRMYFVGALPSTQATSGYPVRLAARGLISEEQEFITFQGSAEANFPTPVIGTPELSVLGTLFGSDGRSAGGIRFSVDKERGKLTASAPIYGTVQAKYTSQFHRLQVRFQEVPGAKDNPSVRSEFAPAVLIAQQSSPFVIASISLNPPDKRPDEDEDTPTFGVDDRSTGERIVLELDEAFPVSLAHSTPHSPGLTAVARVAVYSPHGGVSFAASVGTAAPDPYNLDDLVTIKESLVFTAAQSVSVKYPPVNGIVVTSPGPYSSKNVGGESTFAFITAPYVVALAEWVSFGTYTITGSREVQSNEVVATTSGVAVPLSGIVQAEYSTSRTYVTVYWSREGDWFPPVVLTASDAWGNTESLTISAPERRGR